MNGRLSPLQVSAVYIGTVVGAGFASGQEVLQFFGGFGPAGAIGIVLASLLLSFFGWRVLWVARREEASTYVEMVYAIGGPGLGRAVDVIITFFLFGGVTTMIAGSGAVFAEEFGLSPAIGAGAMAVATLATVLLGFGGVIRAISLVVPVLFLAVFGISAALILAAPIDLATPLPARTPIPYWPLAAVAYASYNLLLAIAVLAPLGTAATSSALRKGALWGGVGLGLGAFAIYLAIAAQGPAALRVEVPMLSAAGRISPSIRFLYSLVLLAEIYSTAVGSLYGFTTRIARDGERLYPVAAVGVAALAFLLSRWGFSNLVSLVYSAVGVAGLIFLAALARDALREADAKRRPI